MNVSDVMNHNVITVRPDTNLADAVRIMLANHVSGLPVLDENATLVGLVTEGDLLRRQEIGTDGSPAGWLKSLFQPSSVAADYVATHSRLVGGVMTREPVYVTPETELTKAVHIMLNKHFKRLPVLKDGALVGTLSRADLLRQLTRKLIETLDQSRSDEQILTDLNTEVKNAKWAPKSGLRISVKDAVVTLGGTIFSDEERQGVITLAENTAGVKQVIDELVFVDPGSGLAFPAPGTSI